MSTTPRGIRNHNPGNLRRDRTPWQGLAAQQLDPEFFTFRAPEYGIRAMARVLITYRDKYRIKRLNTIINRWAPPAGERQNGERYTQNTQAYIDHVAALTGFAADQNLDLHSHQHMRPLVEAMIRHENGRQPYSRELIDRGLALAGIEPATPRKLPTSEARAGATVAGGAAAASGMTLLGELQPALPLAGTLAERLPVIVLTLGVAAIAWLGWRYWREKQVAR